MEQKLLRDIEDMEADEEQEQKYNDGLIGYRKKGNNNFGISQEIEDENNHNRNTSDQNKH